MAADPHAQLNDRMVVRNVYASMTRGAINTQKLTVVCTRGEVTITGLLEKSGSTQPLASFDLKNIDRRLLSVNGVRSIIWNLQNWERTGMTFKRKQGAHSAETVARSS